MICDIHSSLFFNNYFGWKIRKYEKWNYFFSPTILSNQSTGKYPVGRNRQILLRSFERDLSQLSSWNKSTPPFFFHLSLAHWKKKAIACSIITWAGKKWKQLPIRIRKGKIDQHLMKNHWIHTTEHW